jgi:DNA-directed RNA polymerase alpha subunit
VNVLRSANITTVRELCALTGAQLLEIWGISEDAVAEIRAELAKRDWQLNDEMPKPRHWAAMPWAIVNAPSM